jgi:hypothetical protein
MGRAQIQPIDPDELKKLKAKWVNSRERCQKAAGFVRERQQELEELQENPGEDAGTWIMQTIAAREAVVRAEKDLADARATEAAMFDDQVRI